MSLKVFAATLILSAAMTGSGLAQEPIVLKEMGSFHVGGKLVEVTGKPIREVVFTPGGQPAKVDPNGTYQVGQMYVQYFVPQEERGRYPLLMSHGGGLTGVTYETTPDGREGWLNFFLRRGWAIYNSDAVERGRSGWAQYPDIFQGEPVFLTTANPWERFRIGGGEGTYSATPSERKVLPGNQFPVEAYDQFVKQGVPRWTTTDDFILDAYSAEIEKVCPCVIMVHSQAGKFGFEMAQKHPDKVRALVAVEPAGGGQEDAVDALKDIPILMLYGDYIEGDARWPAIRQRGLDFANLVRESGGSIDIVDLPAAGIPGNSHMPMMDKNSDEVAAYIQNWLVEKGLYQ